MKVVFLDIDGVLNTMRKDVEKKAMYSLPTRRGTIHPYPLDCEAIKHLNTATEATGAKIVISSNWRYAFSSREDLKTLADYLKFCGMTGEVIGRTPMPHEMDESLIVESIPRGMEIQHWIDRNSRGNWIVDGFVIVDDNQDMAFLMHKLVITDPIVGITEANAKAMIEQLNASLQPEDGQPKVIFGTK